MFSYLFYWIIFPPFCGFLISLPWPASWAFCSATLTGKKWWLQQMPMRNYQFSIYDYKGNIKMNWSWNFFVSYWIFEIWYADTVICSDMFNSGMRQKHKNLTISHCSRGMEYREATWTSVPWRGRGRTELLAWWTRATLLCLFEKRNHKDWCNQTQDPLST